MKDSLFVFHLYLHKSTVHSSYLKMMFEYSLTHLQQLTSPYASLYFLASPDQSDLQCFCLLSTSFAKYLPRSLKAASKVSSETWLQSFLTIDVELGDVSIRAVHFSTRYE